MPLFEILISGAKGLAVGIISAAVLLFAFTAVAYGMEDPDSVISVFGYLALYLTAALAGISASRFSHRGDGLSALIGAVSGIMLLIVILLVSLTPSEAAADPLSPGTVALMYAGIPALSALSGFLGRKRKSRKPKYRRKR